MTWASPQKATLTITFSTLGAYNENQRTGSATSQRDGSRNPSLQGGPFGAGSNLQALGEESQDNASGAGPNQGGRESTPGHRPQECRWQLLGLQGRNGENRWHQDRVVPQQARQVIRQGAHLCQELRQGSGRQRHAGRPRGGSHCLPGRAQGRMEEDRLVV